jgi:hypothetical protein
VARTQSAELVRRTQSPDASICGPVHLATKLDAEERTALVEGELDARPMGIGQGPKPPSYNVQTAVDADKRIAGRHGIPMQVP